MQNTRSYKNFLTNKVTQDCQMYAQTKQRRLLQSPRYKRRASDRHKVSADKFTAEKILEKYRNYLNISNHTLQFILLLDLGGKIIEANQPYLDFAELQDRDAIDKLLWELAPWNDSQSIQQQLFAAIASSAGGELIRYEVCFGANSFAITTLDFSLTPVWDDLGQVIFLVAEGRDITKYKQTEQRLREAYIELEMLVEERISLALDRERQFASILSHLHDVICRFDFQLRYLYVSPSIEKVTGIAPDRFIGKTVFELGLPATHAQLWYHNLQEALTTGCQLSHEFCYPSILGQRYYHTSVIPEFASDGSVVSILVINRDITDAKMFLHQVKD